MPEPAELTWRFTAYGVANCETSEVRVGMLAGERILVTGGSGFIGRSVVPALLDAGARSPKPPRELQASEAVLEALRRRDS